MNLDPPAHLQGRTQELQLALSKRLNERHLAEVGGEHDLVARIATYELAARMQTAADEAMELSHETRQTHQLYGIDDAGRRKLGEACLIARRLVERGVRFVQIWYYTWDMHQKINQKLPPLLRMSFITTIIWRPCCICWGWMRRSSSTSATGVKRRFSMGRMGRSYKRS